MKTKLLLSILGIAALFLASRAEAQDIQVATTAKTNLETKTVIVTDTYMRAGKTNLVRQVRFEKGLAQIGVQKLYHDGLLLGTITTKGGNVVSITTEPNPKYSLNFDLWHPDKRLLGASIMDTNFTLIDGFNGTNGMLIPVESSQVEKFNQFDNETAEFVKTNNRVGKSSKQLGQELEDFIEKHKND
jgi:hypothetical protein